MYPSCHTCQAPICISKIGIFRQLTSDQQKQIIAKVNRKAYKKGEIVVNEHEELNQFVIVSQGSFKCYTNNKQGKQKTVYYLHLGDFFGQQALFQKTESAFTVEAIQDASVCMIASDTIENLIVSQPEFALSVIKELSLRVNSLENELSVVTVEPLDDRLVKLLVELSKDFGYQTDQGIVVRLPLTQEEMGMRLGVTRESVSRSFKQLEQNQKIRVLKNKLIILL